MATNERDDLTTSAIADAAAHLAAVLDLQLALIHIGHLTELIRNMTNADAGREDREAMLKTIQERTDTLQRGLQLQLQRDPWMHIDRHRARHGQLADQADDTRH